MTATSALQRIVLACGSTKFIPVAQLRSNLLIECRPGSGGSSGRGGLYPALVPPDDFLQGKRGDASDEIHIRTDLTDAEQLQALIDKAGEERVSVWLWDADAFED